MKIVQLKLKNFRGYSNEISVDIDDLTVFVGKNDIGKSTVLEALDIFFNEGKGVVKLDKTDINRYLEKEGDQEIKITVVFENFPTELVIDSSNTTNLTDEYLLRKDGKLEITKKYKNANSPKVFVKAFHPTNEKCSDLLSKKNLDLKNILKEIYPNGDDECSKSVNSEIRKAIWDYYNNKEELNFSEREIELNKEDGKNIWDKLKQYMPIYSLFQSDRENSDNDNEVQDPMKLAVKEILEDIKLKEKLDEVAKEIEAKLYTVSNNTLEKLKEMNPEIANSLKPEIPSYDKLKWASVFNDVSILSDDDIPINKRGSGVKRLVLLNFFRAEAERRQSENGNNCSIIYAFEEPETAQHYTHQKQLIEAFKVLSQAPNTQILLTTHSPEIVNSLEFKNIKLIKQEDTSKNIVSVDERAFKYSSLNEVNYLAFEYISQEYHNELYGYIESQDNWLNKYKLDKETRSYIKKCKKNKTTISQKCLSEYIRHQIHHPENKLNDRFNELELKRSIDDMRAFIFQQYCEE